MISPAVLPHLAIIPNVFVSLFVPGYESPPRETPQRKTGRSRRSPPPAQIQGHDDGGLEEEDAPFMDAVVKVFCTHTEPNYSLPWQRKRQFSSNSSGFIIGGRRVLTNAHSVEHHTQVRGRC